MERQVNVENLELLVNQVLKVFQEIEDQMAHQEREVKMVEMELPV